MTKTFSKLWLKSLRRMGRAQQTQGRLLLESMLPKVVRPVAVRRPKAVKRVRPLLAKPAKALKKTPGLARATVAQPAVKATAVRRPRPAAAAPQRDVAALPGVWQKFWFSASGKSQAGSTRRMLYWLYLPAKESQAPLPLVVMLHGCQQTATDFAVATRMNALAERKGFAVLYPQQSAASDAHRCWHWYKRATQLGQGDVRLIADMIVQVRYKHGLDPSRTYLAGLSAGAALASIVALRHPELIAAVGLHSAPVYGTTDSAMSAYRAMQHGSPLAHRQTVRALAHAEPDFPGMPVMLVHGARDAVVRPINMEQLLEQFEILNAASITRAQPVLRHYPGRAGGRAPRHAYQTSTVYAGRKPLMVKCEIEGLGHAWSGGDSSVPFSEPEGPDATLLLWSFFARHRRVSGDAPPNPGGKAASLPAQEIASAPLLLNS